MICGNLTKFDAREIDFDESAEREGMREKTGKRKRGGEGIFQYDVRY